MVQWPAVVKCRTVDCRSAGSGYGTVAGCCKNGGQFSVSVQKGM
jgi:hypothetical protein